MFSLQPMVFFLDDHLDELNAVSIFPHTKKGVLDIRNFLRSLRIVLTKEVSFGHLSRKKWGLTMREKTDNRGFIGEKGFLL